MATIFDVADLAGVSIKTVSRVLNGSSSVRAATSERVRAAMAELDYRPSTAARELRKGKSSAIGMLFGDPSSGFQSRLHHAALQACNDAGYFLTAGLFREEEDNWDEQLSEFLTRTSIEKMILVPPLCGSSALHDRLIEHGTSFVLISPSRTVPVAHAVCMDDRRAAREVTEHLLSLGHRRIAHITGPSDHAATRLRREGFEAALAAVEGGVVREDWIQPGLFRFKPALECARQILSGPDRPTAIFAANDEMAAAVCFAANSLGLRVPDDLSVVGFDDVAIATTMWPPLTTVAQPYAQMASESVRLLTQVGAPGESGAAAEKVTIDHALKLRQSTAPLLS